MTDASVPTRSRWRRYGLQALLFVAVYLMMTSWQTRRSLDLGQPAPDFELETLIGNKALLSNFRGKRVLLHFWATWCGVCRREFGMLNRLHETLGPDEVLLSVVLDASDKTAVERTVAENAITYPVLMADERVSKDYGIAVLPTTYVINPAGHVSSVTSGMSTGFGLQRRLDCAGRMP